MMEQDHLEDQAAIEANAEPKEMMQASVPPPQSPQQL
jgi:hypothetical protein